MRYHILPKLDRGIRRLKVKDRELFESMRKQLSLFETNERHPSLRNHRLGGELSGSLSISVGMNFRMVYFVEDGEAFFYKMGRHDQVYRCN